MDLELLKYCKKIITSGFVKVRVGKYFMTMQKHQEDVALIDDEYKINDEKVTTDAAIITAQQVAERQREMVAELRKKAAVDRQNAAAADRQSEKAEDGRIDRFDKGEEDKLASSKDGDVPGSGTTSETAKEEASVPTRGTTIVDLNA